MKGSQFNMVWRMLNSAWPSVIMSFICASCHSAGHRETELQRTLSPDGKSLARVIRVDSSGATDSDRFEIFIQYQNSKSSRPTLMFEAHRTRGVKVRWTDAHSLEICYPKADITFFRNSYDYGEEGWNPNDWYWVESFLRRVSDLRECGV